MKIDYSSWETRLLSIDRLKLDIRNPRFSYQSTKEMNQTAIIKYLIERHATYELAKSIAANGYLLGEEPIVCKEGEFYIVLEGNRRVAACKILLNPEKYLSTQKAKELLIHGSIDRKIKCYIAPTRRDADFLIFNKHTGTPLEKWDKISQDAFFVDLLQNGSLPPDEITSRLGVSSYEIKKALQRHAIHQYSIKLFQSEPEKLEKIQEQGFPITNFERFYDDERGLDFLGITFGHNGEILKRLPDKEFDNRFKFIVNQILSQDLTSRTFNNEESKETYFSNIQNYDKKYFHLDIKLTQPLVDKTPLKSCSAKEPEDKEVFTKIKQTRKKPGVFSNYDWSDTGIDKLDNLFCSLRDLPYKRHINIVAIALRCYVDMLIYEFLLAKGKIGEVNKEDTEKTAQHNDNRYEKLKQYLITTYALNIEDINDKELRGLTRFATSNKSDKIPELGNMITYIINHPELLDNNSRLLQVLEKFKKSNSNFIDLTSCNMFVHNQYFSPSSGSIETSFEILSPILNIMYTAIKEKATN